MITYNTNPTLLHTSFDKDDAPTELPFKVEDKHVASYLTTCAGYNEMFAIITVKNSLAKKNSCTHFYLDDALFHKIDSDNYFRTKNFNIFQSEYIKPKYGVINFQEGGQYVYLLLGVNDTKTYKRLKGRYIAVALLKEDFLIGFEEAIITEKGIEVPESGVYSNGMDKGGYISFVAITLAHAGENYKETVESKTQETIYKL